MGALDGILVVAVEQAVAAPTCTQRLADAGARVIKIEREQGETARHYDQAAGGTSAYFAWLNRGKESIILDLKSHADLQLARRMISRADIFIQNLAPGAAQRLDLDAASLCARYPRLIAVDIAGYGEETPAAGMRAYDMLVQAESGLCAVTGTPDARAKVGVSIADVVTGMNAHALVLEALIARGVTGRGGAVQVTMFDGMADLMTVPLIHFENDGRETPRCGMEHAAIYPYAAFACRDGLIMIAVQAPAEWRRFCDGILGDPALALDPRFVTNPDRVRNREALSAIIAKRVGICTRAEMIEHLDRCKIAWGRVSTVSDLAGHPALRRIEADLPGGGVVSIPRPPGRARHLPSHVPALDADGPAIRTEFA